ncbi:MAG: DUF937 domain-containing protein [Oscillospiraceae bacterium]|nr:DUF937 domain-containing protein [Oscillospiraceae bacterium]
MASLLDSMLQQVLSSGGAETLSKQTGADSSSVEKLLSAAVPMLVNSMASNASDKKGAESLATALDTHASKKSAGSDIASLLTGADTDDGAKILNHILGGEDKTTKQTEKLAKKSGLSTAQVISILTVVAPLLLKLLGNTKQKTNTSADGLSSLLSMLTGSGSSDKKEDSTGNLLGSLLGGSTGSAAASLVGSLLGGSSSSKSDSTGDVLGSLLGSLLK